MTTPNLAFITCIESGHLETQSLLLYESIRCYGGRFSQCPIYAFSPRVGHEISPETKKRLDKLSVEHIELVLNDEFAQDPYANKILANAYIENQKKHEFLVFIDSDTLFFREPTALELLDSYDVAVRPVSWKSICTSGSPDDPYDNYWHLLCNYCGVDYESIPLIETFVQGVVIKACYNAGLVAVRASKGIFSKWQDDLITVYRQGLEPKQGSIWPKDQTTLSTAIWGITDRVQILEPVYNYPIININKRQPLLQFKSSHSLIHIHYHGMFKAENLPINPLFQSNFELEAELNTWLLARLPLDSVPSPAEKL
ncbi:MAG: hypothetical protein F6J90_21305 [Moorea sp. SIOASIH]|uniref:hypothetical protein n=1 Tax=Moorena sp. SIOASIH TaxID=2607817 RepID=UPI0013B8AF92|nr:hypothetical protein [Moorena sp. SIOASIH]NEO38731.1 hypothetical protein [Moorena sp. SIOASIH]